MLDPRINLVYLAFCRPDTIYKAGQKTFAGTGLDFSSDFQVVVDAIGLLKQRGVMVMLSVGGATYKFNPFTPATNVVALAADLGCDGIDIDWEPENGAAQDHEFPMLINTYRLALWPGAKLSAAVFSTGAYGKDGNQYKGMNIRGLVSNGSDLDWINLMAYDAGPPPPVGNYDPLGAFTAYRMYYPGPIIFGFEPGPMAWGGHLITKEEVLKNIQYVGGENKKNGIFIWSYQKDTTGSPSVSDIVTMAVQVFVQPTIPPAAPTPAPQPIINIPGECQLQCSFCRQFIKINFSRSD